MPDPTTAADRLERLLHVLPTAARGDGVSIDELARDLGVEPETLFADLAEVTARDELYGAGVGDDIRITLGTERVSVWTSGAFRRPVKLTPLECLCLALGLRRGAADRDAEDDDLLERVETHLATEDVTAETRELAVRAADAEPDPAGVRDALESAVRERRRCAIQYLKPTDPEPERRTIEPHALVHAEGAWYTIAWCRRASAPRAFRLDRVLDARPEEESFEPRDEVDVKAFFDGARVWDGNARADVLVRYSPAVARWVREAPVVREAAEVREGEDGSVYVRHRVGDPDWVVRHVLAYGGEAEIVEPADVRARLGGG